MKYFLHKMCNTCRYERSLRSQQFACFHCRCVKTISRKTPQPKQFYFAADGVPYSYFTKPIQRPTASGTPSCSSCSRKMKFVGPHFRAPPQKKTKQWQHLEQRRWPLFCFSR